MNRSICSIVIVNWKSIRYLIKCIESIKRNTNCAHEIIVVDNYSGSNEREKLMRFTDISLILNDENKGFGAANNQGITTAKGDFIMILNPDTLVLNNAIDRMINFLKENNEIHAVGPKLYYSEELDYHPSIKTCTTPFGLLLRYLPFSGIVQEFWARLTFDPDKLQKVECVWGAAIMFKREVFSRIGFFDTRFFLYSEETDLCKRMGQNDMFIYYYPKSEVIHYGGKSQDKSTEHKNKLIWTSVMKYFEKYFHRRKDRFFLYMLYYLLKVKSVFRDRENLLMSAKIVREGLKELRHKKMNDIKCSEQRNFVDSE